jgi:hypothetical protein
METDYVKLLSAALTPILGLLTAYIAWQQWRTNHLKVRHDLYERRLAIYVAVMEFFANIMRSAGASDLEMVTFLQKTRESYFLFGRDIADYLELLYKKSVDLQYQNSMLHEPGASLPIGEERSRLAHEKAELSKWFSAQSVVARDRFSKYMRLA